MDGQVRPDSSEAAGKHRELRACSQCAKAKQKCSFPTANSNKCQRCERLDKKCTGRASKNLRKLKPKSTPANRVSKLEQKVDSLLNILAPPPASSGLEDERANTHAVLNTSGGALAVPPSTPFNQATDSARPSEGVSTVTSHQPDTQYVFKDNEAESLLQVYQQHLACHFPFIVLDESAAELHRTKPCLLKAVKMAASFRNRPRQRQLGQELTKELITRTFIDGEKSIDILQALLVHVAWYHGHLTLQSQMTNLLHLLIAVLADLGINKPSHSNDRRRIMFDPLRPTYGFASNTDSTTIEQTRALAGCFYLSSVISSTFRRVDAINHDAYLEEAYRKLSKTDAGAHDTYLVHLVKLQFLVERAGKTFPLDGPYASSQLKAPIHLHVEALSTSIKEYEETLPVDLRSKGFLMLHIHAAKIYIHEIGLFDQPWRTPTTDGTPPRLDVLFAALTACSDYFHTFLALPDDHFLTLPYSLIAQLAYALLICSRLSILPCPGWNLPYIRTTLDFATVLSGVLDKLERANQFATRNWLLVGERDDIVERLAAKIRRIQAWYEGQLQSEQMQAGELAGLPEVAAGQEGPGALDLDDAFWDDFMRNFEFYAN